MNDQENLVRLDAGWFMAPSDKIHRTGRELSGRDYAGEAWIPAVVPGTVMHSLIENGEYPDIFMGDNLKQVSREPFKIAWWFRNSFHIPRENVHNNCVLQLDGINYKAAVWLNGHLIAEESEVFGPFRRFRFDISPFIKTGQNTLAIEVFPPKPGEFAIGFVDWNPHPPDRNMGIFRPVTLHFFDKIRIENPFVESVVDTETLASADLTVSAELVNYSNQEIKGVLKGLIDTIAFEQSVTLAPEEILPLKFDSHNFPQLKVKNPRLWWPNNVGEPNLYRLSLTFVVNKRPADSCEQRFGIRAVDDYLTEEGHRGFRINGRKILIKGAGWTDQIFLGDTAKSLEQQIAYVKHMNLNCIRLEGLWGKDHKLYDLCDQQGILIMAGWSCHWEHELHLGKPVDPRYGGITAPEEIDLIAKSWQDQVIWLRNHPSIFVWSVGSDMVPHPDLEKRYFRTFEKYDSTRAYLNSTGGVGSDQNIITKTEIISDISGSSGVKMLGPYDHTPPVYWYTNTHLGGAYGFNTETCPGANVPVLDSIQGMIPGNKLWPTNEIWDYHCSLYEFGTISRFKEAIDKRYGKARDVQDFAKKAQVMNYELMRPMFEAFQINRGNATGIIQWMLNSAWPSLYWQLYDHYLIPTGAFYGAKKACDPLQIIYHYGENAVYLVNDRQSGLSDHKAIIRLLNIDSEIVLNKTIKFDLPADTTLKILQMPEIENLSKTYFLDLRLINAREEVIRSNFYWLSTHHDSLDYEYKFADFTFYTPTKEFADLTLLQQLKPAQVSVELLFSPEGGKQIISVDLTNTSDFLAFFNELIILGDTTKKRIIPVFWEDNYISLLPGENRTVRGYFLTEDLKGEKPLLKIEGWNLKEF